MDPERQRLQEDLRGLVTGDVRCDDVFLHLYASDASIDERLSRLEERLRALEVNLRSDGPRHSANDSGIQNINIRLLALEEMMRRGIYLKNKGKLN